MKPCRWSGPPKCIRQHSTVSYPGYEVLLQAVEAPDLCPETDLPQQPCQSKLYLGGKVPEQLKAAQEKDKKKKPFLLEFVAINMAERSFRGEDLDPSSVSSGIGPDGRLCVHYSLRPELHGPYGDWSAKYLKKHSAIILNGVIRSVPYFVDRIPGTGQIIHTGDNIGYAPVSLNARSTYYGLYTTDVFDITKKLSLNAGARLNVARIGTDRVAAARIVGSMLLHIDVCSSVPDLVHLGRSPAAVR